MSLPEQLHATKITIARETSVGSGSPTGLWYAPRMTAAAVQREIKQQAERTGPHRGPNRREVISEAWSMVTSHEVGLAFLRVILIAHMTARGGGQYTLDPESPSPTYVIETQSESGAVTRYSGAAIEEIRIAIDAKKVVRMDLKWQILRRTLESAMASSEGYQFPIAMVATSECSLAATTATWDADPRTDNAAVMHGCQIYLHRKITPSNYGPDGIPTIHDRFPWNVVGEVWMPETDGITDTAFADIWRGKVALWIGSDNDSIWIQNASGFVQDEELLAYDWRTRRVAFQAMGDNRRALIEFLT